MNLAKVVQTRRGGVIVVGERVASPLSTRHRMCTYIMTNYVRRLEESEAALDAVATAVPAVLRDAGRVERKMQTVLRARVTAPYLFILTELCDLAMIFAGSKRHARTYSQITAAIAKMIEESGKYMPANEEWTGTPRAAPVINDS